MSSEELTTAVETGPGHLPLETVLRPVFERHLRKLNKHLPIAREGSDPAGVHGSRVAIRRLRTVLLVLEEGGIVAPPQPGDLRRRLRRLARRLGPVRDSDVLLAQLEQYAETGAEVAPLREELAAQRAAGRKRLLRMLDQQRTQRLLDDLQSFAADAGPLQTAAADLLARHVAGSAIWRRYERVLRFERELPQASPETLHRLRISVKRLRYTLRLFDQALGPKSARLLKPVVEAQDHLGLLQDAATALDLLVRLQRSGDRSPALQEFAAARRVEHDRLYQGFPRVWDRLSGARFRRDLASLLGQL